MCSGPFCIFVLPRLADGSGFHVIIDVRHVLLEILGEHRNQLGNLFIIGFGIAPCAARVEQDVGDTFHRDRDFEAEVLICAEFASGK